MNAKTHQGDTLLHLVAATGFTEGAQLLIASGADVNAKRADGGTPLQIAESTGQRVAADLFIASGANRGK